MYKVFRTESLYDDVRQKNKTDITLFNQINEVSSNQCIVRKKTTTPLTDKKDESNLQLPSRNSRSKVAVPW